jgi:hypothetical protein
MHCHLVTVRDFLDSVRYRPQLVPPAKHPGTAAVSPQKLTSAAWHSQAFHDPEGFRTVGGLKSFRIMNP